MLCGLLKVEVQSKSLFYSYALQDYGKQVQLAQGNNTRALELIRYSDGAWYMLTQNTTPCHVAYFKLKEFEKMAVARSSL